MMEDTTKLHPRQQTITLDASELIGALRSFTNTIRAAKLPPLDINTASLTTALNAATQATDSSNLVNALTTLQQALAQHKTPPLELNDAKLIAAIRQLQTQLTKPLTTEPVDTSQLETALAQCTSVIAEATALLNTREREAIAAINTQAAAIEKHTLGTALATKAMRELGRQLRQNTATTKQETSYIHARIIKPTDYALHTNTVTIVLCNAGRQHVAVNLSKETNQLGTRLAPGVTLTLPRPTNTNTIDIKVINSRNDEMDLDITEIVQTWH